MFFLPLLCFQILQLNRAEKGSEKQGYRIIQWQENLCYGFDSAFCFLSNDAHLYPFHVFNYISWQAWLSRAPWQHPPSLSTTAIPCHPTVHIPAFQILTYTGENKKSWRWSCGGPGANSFSFSLLPREAVLSVYLKTSVWTPVKSVYYKSDIYIVLELWCQWKTGSFFTFYV